MTGVSVASPVQSCRSGFVSSGVRAAGTGCIVEGISCVACDGVGVLGKVSVELRYQHILSLVRRKRHLQLQHVLLVLALQRCQLLRAAQLSLSGFRLSSLSGGLRSLRCTRISWERLKQNIHRRHPEHGMTPVLPLAVQDTDWDIANFAMWFIQLSCDLLAILTSLEQPHPRPLMLLPQHLPAWTCSSPAPACESSAGPHCEHSRRSRSISPLSG